ncbi:pyridoxal phosphate-dependent decarboxylase family protein [Chondromyces apiculatus]|uniref:Sphingosine-1-phosphate lyase n=1 Tax=Chondromyces apiculatus DSM 436 TaxID=1192034 RepID=A0A017T0P9_9BACT|nr:aspartate aminotransferase family protein [Chondromyces apiculatus]EYF02839.1 Sphingosine-1-phosphate lyase [Chondromyces apiculatus DSM 436]
MSFPAEGRSPADLLAALEQKKARDVPWAKGRVFAYIYDAGPEAMQLVKAANALFLTENGLDPTSFPSVLEMERDVIAAAIDLMNGGPGAKGSMTSGGTESILLSVKTARDHARAVRPEIQKPEVVLPETTHPAFFKACAYFDVKPVVVPVDPSTFCASPSAMEAAITPDTIMIVGSAPSYALGVIDPIRELGEIALKHKLLFHVDCCVGGMYLPFARRLGHEIPDFDLSVPGVTQLSLDFHKYGYAAKGASAILYKDGDLRKYQIFAWSGWIGYTIVNPTVQSSKSGGPIAACWAILHHLGMAGYLDLVRRTQAAAERLREGLADIPGIEVLGEPRMNMLSFASRTVDVFALAEDMKERGWYIQPQFGFSSCPPNIHLSVGAGNAPNVEAFLVDLREAVAARGAREPAADAVELPAPLLALFQDPPPDLFDKLASMIGTDGTTMPSRMDGINNLMNAIPPAVRDRLLVEYIHRLYAR